MILETIKSIKWESIDDIVLFLLENDITSISQGFFTKVYRIEGKILKLNVGDPDYAFIRYYEYFNSYPSIHAPRCEYFNLIPRNSNYHYVMITEELSPISQEVFELISITCLRELVIDEMKENGINFFEILEKYDLTLSNHERSQILGILNFIRNLRDIDLSIDICNTNIMLRDSIWVLNDPFVLLKVV